MTERADRVGQQIGDYRLVRKLGSGGFGTVYLGEHTREHTQAAIKVLQAQLTRSQDLKEFINEARMVRLKHPHILPLLDFGVDEDDIPFLVMPYAPGGTLRNRHPRGTCLSLAMVVSYVTPIASALHYAHSLHLIHRDVKPENILLGPSGEVWLSDFGIVVVAQSTRSVDVLQGVGGTLPYMAPEQIQGHPRPASDQYALGILVYEWLCGRRPFQGTAVEIAMQHAMTPPPPLREYLPTLPSEVEQVVLTALAKDPKQRFATIEAFATALRTASVQVEPTQATPIKPSVSLPSLNDVPDLLPPAPRETIELVSKEPTPTSPVSLSVPRSRSLSPNPSMGLSPRHP